MGNTIDSYNPSTWAGQLLSAKTRDWGAVMRREIVLLFCFASTLLLGCSDTASSSAPVLSENQNPPPSSLEAQVPIVVDSPDTTANDTTADCDNAECCETRLGVVSGDCTTVILSETGCEVVFSEDGSECDPSSTCATGACNAGECISSPKVCDSDDPCMDMKCDLDSGECIGSPKSNGESCSDTPACIGADICVEGVCTAQEAVACAPQTGATSCKTTVCDPELGCIAQITPGKSCNDDNPCTVDDACGEAGVCTGTSVCTCTNDLECEGFFQPCDAKLSCVEGSCVPTGEAVNCDDGNECTTDTCEPSSGTCVYVNISGECDDDNLCTTADKCIDGICAGVSVDCEDGDPCTTGEICDAASGECLPGSGECPGCTAASDCPPALACGGTWECTDGTCVYDGSAAVDCSDVATGPCETASCDSDSNNCVVSTLSDGIDCDDGDQCTANDTCVSGTCQAGATIDCNDSQPCTNDSCDPAIGCVNTAKSGDVCDDGSACTLGDICDEGQCKSTAPIDCDDENPCTVDTCTPDAGCKSTPTPGSSCDDGDTCTQTDTCDASGQCIGTDNICECSKNVDCIGVIDTCLGSPICVEGSCTADPSTAKECPISDDACQPFECSNGECIQVSTTGGPCTDGSLCTTGDTCANGVCQGTAIECDDGNQCTTDSCNSATGCTFAAQIGDCDDGNACTTGESCTASGTCAGGQPVSCEDNNVCTSETCSPSTGCKYSNAFGACDDNDLCTNNDFCSNGDCKGLPVICTGGDGVCTTSICSAESGECEIETQSCDDSNACTLDSCDPATGCVFVSIDCDDQDLCTSDSCDVSTGCVNADKNCADSLFCTIDSCNESTGECANAPVVCESTTACFVGVCSEQAQGCVYSAACNDGLPCTADNCIEDITGITCENTPITCNDDDPCTIDVCDAQTGDCKETPLVCNDDDPCTIDACVSESDGCVFSALCDDNDPCTVDTCTDGTCAQAPLCDDKDPCTTDTCSNGVCSNVEKDCDDGVACTQDACENGECTYETDSAQCDDGNECTADNCIPSQGCSNTPQSDIACSDGNECTENDSCEDGVCLAGNVVCGPCLGADEGEGCNDNDNTTVADFCWQGACAGFKAYTENVVDTNDAISLGKVFWTAGGFITIGVIEETAAFGAWLGRISASGLTIEPGTTLSDEVWVDITTDLAVAQGGSAVQFIDSQWSTDSWLPTAIADLLDGESVNVTAAYWNGEGPAYLTGALEGLGFVARCELNSGCSYETINTDDAQLPRAITSLGENGPTDQQILVTDVEAGNGQYWNDAFARTTSGSWDLDFLDPGPSDKRSRTVFGTSATNAYWAGDNGLLLYRDSDEEWSFALNIINQQSVTDFSQTWTGQGIALLAASREHNNDKRTLYVVTSDTSSTNPSSSFTWDRREIYEQDPVECEDQIACIPPFGGFEQPAALEGVSAHAQTIVLTGWRRNTQTGAREPIYFVR